MCRLFARSGLAGGRLLRRGLSRCLLALAMTLPGAAYPISLSQLLRLPLEELLRLQISAPSAMPPHRIVR